MKNTATVELLLLLIVLIGWWKASGQGEAKEMCSISLYVDVTCIISYRNLFAKHEEQFL